MFGLFMFLNFPFLVLAFFGFLSSRSPFWPSLMYCVRFLDPLRGKFGNFLQKPTPKAFAHHGGQVEQAKERKIQFCPRLGKPSLPSLPSVSLFWLPRAAD